MGVQERERVCPRFLYDYDFVNLAKYVRSVDDAVG